MGYYKIHTRHEEFQCEYCGYPLVVGDSAYEGDEGDGFCTEACALKHREMKRAELLERAVVSYHRAADGKHTWREHFNVLNSLDLTDEQYDEYVDATEDPCGFFCGHDRVREECGALTGTYRCPLESEEGDQ